MDTLRALEHLRNVLTVEEWRQFKSTDDYLWMAARTEGYRRGGNADMLIERGKARREEAWQIALGMARSIVTDDLAELSADTTVEAKELAIKKLAEKLMVQQDLIPPTYTHWSHCSQCGRVPVPEEFDTELSSCPWCIK